MTLTNGEFNLECIKFIEKCSAIDNSWTIFDTTAGRVEQQSPESLTKNNLNERKLMLRKIELISSEDDELETREYTVVYSDSFEVPILYFCISNQDGCPKSYNKVIIKSNKLDHDDELNQTITQVEHPVMFRPFYMIHPCRTKAFMELHKTTSRSYLITWLSTLATLIDLKIDLKLFID